MATNPFDKYDGAPAAPNPFDKFDDPNYKPSGAFRRGVTDKVLGVASGALGLTKAIADAAGANNQVSQTLDKGVKGIDSALSPEAQADRAEQSAIMDEAKGKGVWDQVKAGASAFGVAPVQTTAQGVGSAIPFILGAAGGAPVAAGMGVTAGVGTVKGAIFEDIKKRSMAAGMPEAQATAAATKAQEYTGPNQDQIALGGALGAADALTGVSRIGGKLLRDAAGKPVAAAAAKGVPRGVLARAGLGAAEEMPLEAVQGGQEQYAANVAANRAGYGVDPMEGVVSNATLEALASAGPGAALGALNTGPTPPPAPLVPPTVAGSAGAVPPAAGQAAVAPGAAAAPTNPLPTLDPIDPNANATSPTPGFDPATALAPAVDPRSVPLPVIDPEVGPLSKAASLLADGSGVVSAPDPVAVAKSQEEAKAAKGKGKGKGKGKKEVKPKPVPPTPVAQTAPKAPDAPAAPAGPITTAATRLGVTPAMNMDQATDGPAALFGTPKDSSTTGATPNAKAPEAIQSQPQPAPPGPVPAADARPDQDVRGAQVAPGPLETAAPADGAAPATPARAGGVNVQAQFQTDQGQGAGQEASPSNSTENGTGPENGTGATPQAVEPPTGTALATTRQAGDVGKPKGLSVTFAGKTYPVESVEDAQRKWNEFRDSADGGEAAGVSQIGNGVRVTDQDGNLVARISYNGRAWDGEGLDANEILMPGQRPATLMDKMTDAAGGPVTFGDIRRADQEQQSIASNEVDAYPERWAASGWASAAYEDREQFLRSAGFEPESQEFKDAIDSPWNGLNPTQRARLAQAINAPAKPKPQLDDAAHAAATSPRNALAEPTDAQKEAGNYPKGHVRMSGMDLSIENPEGSVRSSKAGAPVKWQTTMKHHYGYIKGTIGNDKDHVDVFIKPGTPLDFAGTVFVVDQIDPKTGEFDEHKVMIGFDNQLQAKNAYQSNYAKGWKGMESVTAMPFADFKDWVFDGPKNKPLAAEKAAPSQPATESPLVKAMNDLADVRARIESQGRVADDRLLQRERQLAAIVKELEAEAPAADAAPAEAFERDKDGNRIFKEGERVKVTAGWMDEHVGKHGEVIEVGKVTMRSIMLFSGSEGRSETSYHYNVRTDGGHIISARSGDLELETGEPPKAVPDVRIDGIFETPGSVLRSIDYAKSSVRVAEGKLSRAKTEKSRKEHNLTIVQQKAKIAKMTKAYAEWAEANPDAAPKPPEPAAPGPATGTAAGSVPEGFSLVHTKHTKTGEDIWVVKMAKRLERDAYNRVAFAAKAKGGSWSKFTGGFNFGSEDGATEFIAAASKIVTPDAPAPKPALVLAANEVVLGDDSPYIYAKTAEGWTWRVKSSTAGGKANPLSPSAPLIQELEQLLRQKNGESAPAPAPAGEVTSETARRAEFALANGTQVKVTEHAERGRFSVMVKDGPDSWASYGSFSMADGGGVSARKYRANWAESVVDEAANTFSAMQRGETTNVADAPAPGAPAAKTMLEDAQHRYDTADEGGKAIIQPALDILKAEANQDALNSMFDDLLAEEMGTAAPQPAPAPAPAAAPEPAPAPEAAPDALSDQAKAAKAKMLSAAGKLAQLLSKNTRMNITPEQEQAMLPIVIELFEGAMELGYVKFKQAARYVREFIAGAIDQDAADSIPIDTLQGAYIATARRHKGKDITSKADVIAVESVDELTEPLETPAEKADTAPDQPPETLLGANNDTGRNAADDRQLLDDAVPQPSQDDGQGGDPAAVDGLRTLDPAADGRPQDDRSGRGDSLDGDTQPVLPGTPAEVRPLADSPVGRTEERPDSLAGENPGNFEITFDLRLGEGTDGQKIKANLDAIRTLRLVQKERRFPTNEEQRVMARYVGWGGLKTVFDPNKKDANDLYGKAQRELRELLNPQEYRAANGSIRNAHYTAQGIVEGMWRVARHMGFKGGRVLEPTVGIGNFIGLQPKDMAASSEWHASELDTVTGQMAALLYPEANVLAATGFQDAPFADDAFDLVIGNPPFGQQPIEDKHPNRKHLSGMKIHNYIIAKSGMHLRPGGVMSLVVTHRFLDTANPEARDVLASDFKFLGAFRLPNNAFAANAGTEVVTDVIFLQKLRPDEPRDRDASWLDVNGKITVDGQDIRVNRYYQDNPTHILGRSATDGTMYGGRTPEEGGQGEYTVHGDGRDLGQAIDNLITGGFAGMAGIMERNGSDMSAAPAMLMQSDLPVGGVMLDDDGKIRRRELDDAYGNAVVVEITPETLWKEQAAEWQALQTSLLDIRERAKDGRVTAADAEEFLALARFTFKSDGTKRAEPSKAEAAVYKLVDALAKPESFKWDYDNEGLQIGLALARKQLGEKGYKSLKGMLDLRNRALRLIRAEQTDDPKMEELRSDLNTAYDAFVKANGFLSDPKNSNLLDGDIGVEAGLEASFNAAVSAEVSKSTGIPARKASATKADILKQRVNFPYKEITTAATSADALSVSLSEHGKVDLPYMAKITGKSILEVINDLSTGENPQLFRDPETNEFQEAERYLSGNVRHKLEVARERNETANIKALEKVQPAPKTKSNVTPNIRGMWVPEAIFAEFLQSIGYRTPRISILASQGIMTAEGGPIAITDFGTQFRHARATPVDMFNAAAAGKPLIIYDKDSNGNRVRNDAMTKEVTALVDRMAKVFQEWAYSDDRRADAVVAAFNEKMNTHVKRTYDGVKYLRQVGASPSIKLRRTQKNAAWRMIQEQTMLADHVVGAGKTFTLITGIMERRRMGLSRKPMVAVPNHLVVQWARDFYKLYPSAKVLAATPADFARKNRRRLLARIATGDYDAIIIGHSSLGFIETPADDLREIVDEKLAGLRETMEVARANKESKRTLGQIEDRIERYEARLQELAERPTDEIGIDFKSMGIDHLSVDEAHEFKNLEYSTSGDRVKGMNDPNGSKKAFDLYSKVRGLLGRKGGVVFATGTPVSNSLVEIYTVMSYLAHDELKLRNQDHFDAWSGAYASTETSLEYTSTQKLKPARVLAGLNNLSALRQLYEQFADIITMADLKRIYAEEKAEENKRNGTNLSTDFPIPRVRYGARQLNSGPVTKAQQEYMDYLVARMTVIEQRKSDRAYPAIDNPLNVLTDARKMSLDIRIVDPTAPRDENGKVMRAAKNIKAAYDASDANRGTQLVFCDLSTPAKTAAKEAKRMVTEALTMLVGEKQVKATRARSFDGKPFEAQWKLLREAADRIIDDPATDEKRRDQVSEYFDGIEDAEATMLTADIGFSVYDDMRNVLVEMGIPEAEIAFIHDYNTPEQKEKLFDRVNNGYIRVLMGSTMKMGAGTNAQRRMVALHHMDAPWRPSDVEQREGRIIRQGNLFATLPELIQGGVNELYDPEFEVGIDAYSTENTSDTVMWQVLERKARAIEQFRAGGLDSTEEEGGDSNQYAEFMASSTGNPVFRLKLEAERRLTELTADISGALITKSNAAAFMQRYEASRASSVAMRDAAQAASGFTSASYGGQSGTVEEYEAAMKDAEAKYMERFAEYQTRRSDAEVAIAAWELQPESTRGEKPKIPTAPSRPNLMTNTVQTNSGFARAIGLALKEAKPGKQVVITLSDSAKIVIDGEEVVWKDEKNNQWNASLRMGDQKIQISFGGGLKATDSSKLVYDLTPTNIAQGIERALRNAKDQIEDLDARKVDNERRARLDVDTSKRDAAEAELRWYERQVRFAEIESDVRRSSRPNRYIARDRRRPLGQMAKVDLAPVQTIEVDGETYTTTGVQDGTGSYMNMQATRDSDGLPAVVQIRTVASGKNETQTSVVLQPASIPFKPKPGKSTNLRQTGAPEANETDIVFNTRDDAPFYSALSREVGAIPAKAQGAPGWAMNIAGLVKAGKVKQDEVDWSGVLDWLKMQPGKVTREQVAQFLQSNGVRVTETVLGTLNTYPGFQDDVDLLERNGFTLERNPEDANVVAFMDEGGDLLSADDMAAFREGDGITQEAVDAAYRVERAELGNATGTKYAHYQLPGGTNYREVLLTLPAKSSADQARAEYEAWASRNGLQPNATFTEERYKRETGKEAPAPRTMTAMNADAAQNFRSSHWDQPNVLAHIRVNDRTDSEGKRVLFIEEIQSDWGQEGKRKGFTSAANPMKAWKIIDANGDGIGSGQGTSEAAAIADWRRVAGNRANLAVRAEVQPDSRMEMRGTPAAPFVTKTDAWLSLALKRIVKMAVDEGYDRVAFVNGEQSAERYDLSKRVEEIRHLRQQDGTYDLAIKQEGSRPMVTMNGRSLSGLKESDLEELVGKEIAKKIVAQEGPRGGDRFHKLSGLDLKVGGEGMKAFYDRIVPNTLKDVLRKVGGAGIETIDVAGGPTSFGSIKVYERSRVSEREAAEHVDRTKSNDDLYIETEGDVIPAEDAVNFRPGRYNEGSIGESYIDAIVNAGYGRKFYIDRERVPMPQPGFTITPAMREKAAGGLPMFARQGYTAANGQPAGTPDLRPDAARNIGVLERAIGGGADSVHPYDARVVPGSELLQRIAGAFGESFQGFGLRAGLSDRQRKTFGFFNGAYLKGTIYLLDRGNDRPHLAILGHELAHRMRKARPDLYQRLVDAIDPYINTRYDTEFVNTSVASQVKGEANIKEEFIGEVLSDGFMDKQFWRALGDKNPSLLGKVVDFIGGLIDQIKSKLGYTVRTARYLRDYDKVMQLAGEIMGEYGLQVPTLAGGGIAFNQADGNVVAFGADGPQKEFDRFKRLVDQVGQEYTTMGSTMTFEEYKAKVKPLQDQMWAAHFKLERWKAGRPATSTEEVFPGYREIPIGTRIMATHGMKYPEPTMGTVVGRRGLRVGEKAYVLPEVDFGDGDRRAVLPGDIKEVFDGPKFNRRGEQTDTAEFKAWFGDSKVVDAEGKPLVVYHGTVARGDFSRFGPTSYFTADPAYANFFNGNGADRGRTMPVYLSLRNPLDARELGAKPQNTQAILDFLDGAGVLSKYAKGLEDSIRNFGKSEWWYHFRNNPQLLDAIKDAGYDGLIQQEGVGGNIADAYVAFDPTQIKSAIGNRGTFDPGSDDIRFNRIDTAQTLSRVTETLKQATSPIGTVSLWDKTVGTQYHKATKDADFKKVFDGYVQQTDDTAHYAIEAERLAPSILMRLESMGDVARAMRNFDPRFAAKQKADLAAVSKALFANIEGETGVKQVRYDERSLREIFNLTPKQIEMYYQARAAVDQSIERLAQTFAAQMGRDQGLDIERVKNYDLDDTVAIVKEHIQDAHDEARATYENARQLLAEITPEDEMADETAAELAKQMRRVPKGPSKAETERQLERLDQMVEHARFLQENAYMPAMRFGQYAVTVADQDGEVEHFEMFESQMAANLAAIRLGKEYPKSRVHKSVMNPQQYEMFKGVSPETVELFAKFTGMDQNEAYQDYIALAKSARSVKVRELQRKGIAGFSEDATRVMASFLTSNARQAAINVNIGDITDALASKSLARKGDVQREAQKLHKYMSDPLEEARRLRGFLFLHFIGGSIASAMVNLTQPVLQTAPYLSQFAKGKTARIMAQAAKMATTGKIEDKELRAAAKRAAEDGITEPHEIHQLMADASGSSFGGGLAARAAVKAWGGFFSLAEAFNRRLTFLAAYQTAQETGEADPYEFARKAVIETQGLYAKANRPNWARGPVGATLFTFKQFSISYVEFIARMPRKQKLIALGVLLLVAGAQGLPFAEDVEDLIDTIGQSLGYNTNSKKLLRQVLAETFGETLGEILNTGIFSQTGVDVHGRLGMGNLIPGTAIFLPSETDKARTLSEVAGPLGGILMSMQKALAAAQRGDLPAAGREMAPVAVKNLLQGAEMARTGVYKDSRGYKVTDVDALDSFYKMLGLQPGKVAKETRKLSDALQDKSMVTMMESMIADRWAAGVANKEPDQVAQARATLAAWNANNPDFRIVIKPTQIMSRVKKIRETRADRFIKTVPREVRGTMMRELQ